MSLQNRFLLILGCLSVFSFAVFALINQSNIRRLEQDEISVRLQNHLQFSSVFFENIVDETLSNLDLIANDSLTRRYFSADEVDRYQLFHTELTKTLQRYLRYGDYYSEISILLPDGYKELYVLANDFPEFDEDAWLENEKLRLLYQDEVSSITYEKIDGLYYLKFYRPFYKIPSMLKSDFNPIIGYISIAVPLAKLSSAMSSGASLSIINIEGVSLYDVDTAEALAIDPDRMKGEISLKSQSIFSGLDIVSAINHNIVADELSKFFAATLIEIIAAIITLLVATVVLMRWIILKPIAAFSELMDNTDIETFDQKSLTEFRQHEFGQLVNKFNQLMSRLKLSSSELQRQALTDTLTGLPNRAALYRLLKTATVQYERISLLFLDLDGFKKINDLYGHDVGDDLLVAVAKRLQTLVRNEGRRGLDYLDIRQDAVFRLGGDEFTVVLLGQSAELVSERIVHSFRSSFTISGQNFYAGVSIGIAESPADTKDPALLVQYSDMAMYAAKQKGSMHYCRFSQSMVENELRRLEIEDLVREGIEFNRFEAWFQPKIDCRDGSLVGVEALARLRRPDGSLVSPGEFIPVAQSNGVMDYITCTVVEQTCQLLQSLQHDSLVASVNISPSQLTDFRLIADIRFIMWRYQVSPNQIEFEMTEEEVITNFEETKSNLSLIQSFGFRTALDDFGSGYSSLGQLKKFQFDVIKLDRVFVSTEDYQTDASVGVIVSIKSLADRLNMSVVVEGVETLEQVNFVKSLGIYTIQGFYYAKPMPENEFLLAYQMSG